MARGQSTAGVAERRDITRIDGLWDRRFVHMYPTAAIAVGDWVAFDLAVSTNGTGVHCVTAPVNSTLVVGVAVELAGAASTITPILVQTFGIYSLDGGVTATVGVNVLAATGAVGLMISGATAGRAIAYSAATATAVLIGTGLAVAGGGNTAPVFIHCPRS